MKQALYRRLLAALGFCVLILLVSTCGRGSNRTDTTVGVRHAVPRAGLEPAPTISLADVLRQIDAYPVPKGVSLQTWTMLTAELKRLLIARSKDGKTLSIAPVGAFCGVTDLAAASNAPGTQATLSWTEALAGDCNNDGQVFITDLQPIAAHYSETSSGPGSAAYLADANGDGQVFITDLQPVAADYGMHIQGYRVLRGHWNGTTTVWDSSFRPNVGNPANTAFSSDRTTTPPTYSRPVYTYSDDISGLTDKSNVRYQVVAYGDGACGEGSNIAVMPPPPTFSVSGTVTASGVGLAGVTMTLTPGGLNATTQADGTYTITNVPNGTYTLTPTLSGYGFTPPTRSVAVSGADMTGQDFTAAMAVYSVSGTVRQSGIGLSGVTMTLAPGGLTATTQANGAYLIPNVPNGSYTMTPTLAEYVFTPPTHVVTVADGDATGVDFTAAVQTYIVSGLVTASGVALSGVLMTLTPGGLNATTQADGTYGITGVADGSYALTPSKAGYCFTPASRPVTVSGANVNGQDFTARGGLADSAWPKFHANAQNTGLSPYVGAQTNALKWSHPTGGWVFSSPAIGTDGTVYVGSCDNSLYALSSTDGSVKWSYATGDAIDMSSPAIGADGTVYIGSVDKSVYAFSPTNGSVKWTHPTGSNLESSPAIGADCTVYIGSNDYNVYALNPADGSVNWAYTTGTFIYSSAAIGADGTVYIARQHNNVYALDPADGSVKWTVQMGGYVVSSPAVGADGTVYIASDDGEVCALNPADGSVKWAHPTGGYLYSSPAISADGTVYIGSWDNNVYALNPADGSVKWIRPTDSHVLSSPAIGADGTVYIGSFDHSVYALEPADGSVKWAYATGDVVQSSPSIGADGTVYIGSNDGNVYAFGP